MSSIFNQYLDIIGKDKELYFLNKYLNLPSLVRLKNIGYFCGMDYASKDIYDFSEKISRFNHSLSVALLTWKFTKDKKSTLAGLFHDISTPCFSHVIDYMNKDYEKQESTEIYTENILKNDLELQKFLEKDDIKLEDIINFKKYSIVDNDRPKLCTDRLDGIILTGLYWTKNLSILDVKNIINNIKRYVNEYDEEEIGFIDKSIYDLVLEVNRTIDIYCHSKEDKFMMELLANVTKHAIDKHIIRYEDLYVLHEDDLFSIFKSVNDIYIRENLYKFENIKLNEIPYYDLPEVKIRKLKPLLNNKRI